VQREAERREPLVVRGQGRQAFERVAEVVAQEADQAAQERRGLEPFERGVVGRGVVGRGVVGRGDLPRRGIRRVDGEARDEPPRDG